MLEVLVYTGIRRAELTMLREEDVERTSCRLLVRKGKGGKQRVVFLPEAVVRRLLDFSSSTASKYLFPGRDQGPMSVRNVNYIVARAGEGAGVQNPNPRYRYVTPHLIRHSFARNWKRAGGSWETLQKILGHSSIKTTLDVYGTESQAESEANYRRVVTELVATP